MTTTTDVPGGVLIIRAWMEGKDASSFRARLVFGSSAEAESGMGLSASSSSEVVVAVESWLADLIVSGAAERPLAW